MSASLILQVALPVPLPRVFDYLPGPGNAEVGSRVLVPFGKRKMVGVVASLAKESEMAPGKLQSVEQVFHGGEALLDAPLMDLLAWCWRYYKHAPGEVVTSALPPALRSARGQLPEPPLQYCLTREGRQRLEQPAGRARVQFSMLEAMRDAPALPEQLAGIGSQWRKTLAAVCEQGWVTSERQPDRLADPTPGPELTREQEAAVVTVSSAPDGFSCHLLDGVTGSGKTEVYMCLLEQVLARGGQAMVLVPEIGLTPQLLRRFSQRLGLEPAVIHSGLSAGEAVLSWEAVRTGHVPLLVGTRSALFTPMPRLEMIILDEEHDASFKQQDGFRYSARDVAVKRAADLGIPVVLGSATPSLESLKNAIDGRYAWHRLRERATRAALPAWRVLDMRQQRSFFGLTPAALEAIEATIGRGEQVMVFLNRRGYAPVLMCQSCGWFGHCERCDSHMTWHRQARRLCCHHCGSQRRVPDLCPDCRADALAGAGEGTQQLEESLAQKFPDVSVLRFDRDQVKSKGVMNQQLDAVREGGPCLLVGTQMLAKGHHFPAVTLVVIVNIDQAMYSADYRALERMGQMILQVAGRAGRVEKPGTVILQTLHPDHPALGLLLNSGYEEYARWLLHERQLAGLPPSGYQALLRSDAHERGHVQHFLEEAAHCFPSGPARMFGPVSAIMERVGGRSRMYLVLQSESRAGLHGQIDGWLPLIRALKSARRVRWSVDIDPQEL